MASSFAILCLTVCTILGPSALADDFKSHAVLDPNGNFQIYWNYDKDSITIKYEGMSKGWIGLGFSPNGAMTGADIAVFWVDTSGKGYVSDRHAAQNGFPPEDAHQDYTLLSYSKNDTHIIVTFTRKLITCDPEDWPLGDDTTRVLYAMNDNIPIDKDHFDKHTTRGSKSLLIFADRPDMPDDVPPEPGATALEFRVSNVSVPEDLDTYYWCEFRAVPKYTTKKQIIKIEPAIQSQNNDVVHHLLIYICYGMPNATKYVGVGGTCFYGDLVQLFGQCQVFVLGAWAKGGLSVTLPDNLGIPVQNPNEDLVVMIEMHYDNSQYKKGVFDSSGLRFWLTDKLRPIDVGQAGLGVDVDTYNQLLPPGIPEITNYGFCTARCTKHFPADGIKIMGALLHTHLAGRKIRLLHYRNGEQLPNIISDDYYDFDYQDFRQLQDPITVLPGDDLVVECVYSTTDRTTSTFGGPSTRDEMCLAYINYYPAAYTGFACVSGPERNEVLGALDNYDNTTDSIKGCSQSLDDCVKNYTWTDAEKRRVMDVERNGTHHVYCLWEVDDGNTTSTGIDLYHEVGYPKVTKPFVPQDPCTKGASTLNAISQFAVFLIAVLLGMNAI